MRQVLEIGIGPGGVERVALPPHVVGVTGREIERPARGLAARHSVCGLHLVEEQPKRPAVGHDVVHDEDERVPAGSGLHERRPEERRLLQIERLRRQFADDLLDRVVRRRSPIRGRHIHHPQMYRHIGVHDLDRLATVVREARSQRLVPPDGLPDRVLQQRGIRRIGPDERREVVSRATLQPVQKPESLLRERQGTGADGRRRAFSGRPGPLDEPKDLFLVLGKLRLELRRQRASGRVAAESLPLHGEADVPRA